MGCLGLLLVLWACAGSAVLAAPQQIAFSVEAERKAVDDSDFNVLHRERIDLSGISPYFSQGERRLPPSQCNVVSAVYLLRHSSIASNDDEFEETMEPFIKKVAKHLKKHNKQATGALAFLNTWESAVKKEDQEKLTNSGKSDAKDLGTRLRSLYPQLLPNNTAKFLMWTADAPRDVDTARSLLAGMLPDHSGSGNGDGHVKLVEVPVKSNKDWAGSLTPHKACSKFSKKRGRPERFNFEKIYTKPIIKRFDKLWPKFHFKSGDIVAMQQLCGYETVISGSSQFCELFTKEEILDFEYSNDIHYYYMEGPGSKIGPVMGFPFLKNAARQLWHSTNTFTCELPAPKRPPSKVHDQDLFLYLTHREEPPAILTTLGIYNDSSPLSEKYRMDDRKWQTSRIIPFLGHVALERMHCEGAGDFVRVLVNEQHAELPACHSGIDGSCPLLGFEQFLEDLEDKYGDFEGVCGKVKL